MARQCSENRGQLTIHRVEDESMMQDIMREGEVSVNDIILVPSSANIKLTSVDWDNTNKKLTKTDTKNVTSDIITATALKNAMMFPAVATSGSYNDLSNLPQINGVILTGNKTTADLRVSFNDLADQPNIPQLTNSYSSTDTSKAMTGFAVSNALQGYVPTNRSVIGGGALEGGGDLSVNRTITHKTKPVGLTDHEAVKIAIDNYGHVEKGTAISASDIGSQPSTSVVMANLMAIDLNLGTNLVLSDTVEDEFIIAEIPSQSNRTTVYWVNLTDDTLHATLRLKDGYNIYYNADLITEETPLDLEPRICSKFDIQYIPTNGTPYIFIEKCY